MPTLLTAGDAVSAASSLTAASDGLLNIVVGPAGGKVNALAIDAAGNLNALGGHRLFNRGNVLGAVTQAAGVPTGAVIERGSNANGEFVRFADGTQICIASLAGAITMSAYGTALFSGSRAWTLPAAFVGAFSAAGGGADNVVVGFMSHTGSSATTATFAYYSINGSVTGTALNVVAIGRWF